MSKMKTTGMKANEIGCDSRRLTNSQSDALELKQVDRVTDYYQNVVKRDLYKINAAIDNASNDMERRYYEDEYSYKLKIYAEALDITITELQIQIQIVEKNEQD